MAVILVTGSAGFIGFHLAKALLEAGETVIGLDNFNSYYAPELKRARTKILSGQKNFFSVERDLTDRQAIEGLFKDFSPEVVCHLAAQAGVRYSLQNPFAYQQSNLEGFVNLIEVARLFSCEKVRCTRIQLPACTAETPRCPIPRMTLLIRR